MAPELIHDRFDVDQVSESLAYREREEAWSTAWARSSRARGSDRDRRLRARDELVRATYPHNIVLEVACELGFLGLAALLVMVVPVRLPHGARGSCAACRAPKVRSSRSDARVRDLRGHERRRPDPEPTSCSSASAWRRAPCRPRRGRPRRSGGVRSRAAAGQREVAVG
jgi:hypothetical protein